MYLQIILLIYFYLYLKDLKYYYPPQIFFLMQEKQFWL